MHEMAKLMNHNKFNYFFVISGKARIKRYNIAFAAAISPLTFHFANFKVRRALVIFYKIEAAIIHYFRKFFFGNCTKNFIIGTSSAFKIIAIFHFYA